MKKESNGSAKAPVRGAASRPRVLLADREAIFLFGLRAILEPKNCFEIVGEVATSQELLTRLSIHKPRILLMGFRLLCGRDALGLAPEIQKRSPDTAIIVLLPGNSVLLTGRILTAGVRGILARSARIEALLPTIEKVMGGQVFVDPELSISRPRPDSTAGQVDPGVLTSRELEVLRLFGMEKSYKDIASQLGLSIKTVGAHREHIKTKLNLGSSHAFFLVAKAYVLWEASGVDYLI
ncbi:MAG: response regulator transcription factor [Verrucomicrobia bacterium]|nr:response regulator transcription factor [Verrucomicrobiota bacterium]